jgi:hypothetical protein
VDSGFKKQAAKSFPRCLIFSPYTFSSAPVIRVNSNGKKSQIRLAILILDVKIA